LAATKTNTSATIQPGKRALVEMGYEAGSSSRSWAIPATLGNMPLTISFSVSDG
jgi:hypothetical protein